MGTNHNETSETESACEQSEQSTNINDADEQASSSKNVFCIDTDNRLLLHLVLSQFNL